MALGTTGLAGCSGGDLSADDVDTTDPEQLLDYTQQVGEVNVLNVFTGLEDLWNSIEEEYDITINGPRTPAAQTLPRAMQERSTENVTHQIVGMSREDFTLRMIEGDVWEAPPEIIRNNFPGKIPEIEPDNVPIYAYIIDGHAFHYNADRVDGQPPATAAEIAEDYQGELILDNNMPYVLAGIYDANGRDAGQEVMRNLGEAAEWTDSFFDCGQAVASGDYALAITLTKYQWYDWGGPLELNNRISPEIPRVQYNAFYGLAQEAPNRPAGIWFLYHMLEDERLVNYLRENVAPPHYPIEDAKEGNLEEGLFVFDLQTASNVDIEQLSNEWQELGGVSQ